MCQVVMCQVVMCQVSCVGVSGGDVSGDSCREGVPVLAGLPAGSRRSIFCHTGKVCDDLDVLCRFIRISIRDGVCGLS